MRKQLWVLNLALLAAIALIGRQLRNEWKDARDRERQMLAHKVKPAPPPPVQIPAPPQPVQASGYLDVAQQMLFSKDRNPNVVIEAAPPKPVPPFPKFHGVMNLGDGLMAILSEGTERQKPFHAGDQVGQFKLTEIGADTLVFEWDQKKYPKRFAELMDRSEAPAKATVRAAAPSPPPTPKPVTPAAPGPGADMGGGLSACNPNDSSPAGTVVNGKRKVVTNSPFGKVCRWEPVQ